MGGILGRIGGSLFERDPMVGRVVPIHGVPYFFQERLGKGGFGAVFRATGPNGMPVAIKTINLAGLPPDRSANLAQTYLNEVALLERLRQETHHVVRIFDFDFDPRFGAGYIVMELGQENLLILINRLRGKDYGVSPAIDLPMIKAFWRQMVSIIHTLHANSIVHMDLKPDNLILFGDTLKIADLGISKKQNAPGRGRVGTLFFSAPEIMEDMPGIQRYYGPKADIWSLGAILYFMVYGRPPTYHHLAANPPPGQFAHPDPYLNDMLRRTLVKSPYARADINAVLAHPFTRI